MPRILPVVLLSIASVASLSCTARPQKPAVDASEPVGECSLQWREPAEQSEPGAVVSPVSLTAADGTGLELISLTSRAVVEDPLAFTELHMVFQNPQDRQIEGRFEINLPTGAAISRFAMLINGQWQEAEVVELQAARRAYEDALHRRQDRLDAFHGAAEPRRRVGKIEAQVAALVDPVDQGRGDGRSPSHHEVPR